MRRPERGGKPAFLEYISSHCRFDSVGEIVDKTFGRIVSKREATTMTMTLAEKLRREGRVEGKVEGKRDAIAVILKRRFGSILVPV